MIKSIAQREPALTGTVLTMVCGVISGLVGHPEFSPIFVACGLTLLGIRAKVTPVAKADDMARVASTASAIQAVTAVGSAVTGPAGEITEAGLAVAHEAVQAVLGAKK